MKLDTFGDIFIVRLFWDEKYLNQKVQPFVSQTNNSSSLKIL
jgi:hypothetical protein